MALSAIERRLQHVLYVDAGTCAASGMLMTFAAEPLAELTALPAALLLYAGASLFPIAALMAFTRARALGSLLVWLIIAGNALWTLACLTLMVSSFVTPNAMGQLFLAAQAGTVALLTWLELSAYSQLPSAMTRARASA